MQHRAKQAMAAARAASTTSKPAAKGSRFLAQDHKSRSTRKERARKRVARGSTFSVQKKPAAMKKPAIAKQRRVPAAHSSKDYHKRYPCCGNLKRLCKCDWTLVEAHLDLEKWREFKDRLQHSALVFARDTADVGSFLPLFSKRVGQHYVMAGEHGGDFRTFLFRMFVLRRYNRENVWLRLVPAIPTEGEPDWEDLGERLQSIFDEPGTVFSSSFRYTQCNKVRNKSGQWQSLVAACPSDREVALWRAVYAAVPTQACEAFAAEPSREHFGDMYNQLLANLQRFQRGAIGEYSVKCMLDMVVVLGAAPDWTVSCWPVACPGYTSGLAMLFPGLPTQARLQALYWVHMQLCLHWRFEFPESVAHLCWHHRRVTGQFDDMM